MGHKGDLVLGRSLGGAVIAIGGAYSSSVPEAAQVSAGSHSTTAHIPTPRVHVGPVCPAEWFHSRVGLAEAGGSDWL